MLGKKDILPSQLRIRVCQRHSPGPRRVTCIGDHLKWEFLGVMLKSASYISILDWLDQRSPLSVCCSLFGLPNWLHLEQRHAIRQCCQVRPFSEITSQKKGRWHSNPIKADSPQQTLSSIIGSTFSILTHPDPLLPSFHLVSDFSLCGLSTLNPQWLH